MAEPLVKGQLPFVTADESESATDGGNAGVRGGEHAGACIISPSHVTLSGDPLNAWVRLYGGERARRGCALTAVEARVAPATTS